MNQTLNFSKPQEKNEYGYYYSAKDIALSPFCCTKLHLFVMDEHVSVVTNHPMDKQQQLFDKQKHLSDSKQHLATSKLIRRTGSRSINKYKADVRAPLLMIKRRRRARLFFF